MSLDRPYLGNPNGHEDIFMNEKLVYAICLTVAMAPAAMDDDGYIWAGSTHQVTHRYDPRTGSVKNVPLPYRSTAASYVCVGDKVTCLVSSTQS